MGELVEGFGGKVSGELVRAADWNGMLSKVEEMFTTLSSSVTTRIDALTARANALETQITGLVQRVGQMEPTVTAVRERMHRLDLRAATTSFAIGQRGEIVARVAALDGSTLNLTNAATRPWIDFVTVWGSLKPADGFNSLGGAGDQTLSVQVNASGEARVLIRAAHAEAFAEDEEREIEGFLSTRPQAGNNATIASMILAANTPQDATLQFAYKAVSTEYDRAPVNQTQPILQRYMDNYYLTQPARVSGNFTSVFTQRWRDYRATVMAFLKPDGEPTTADGASATASIQVTFRDWIAPWLVVDYLPAITLLQVDYANRFRNVIGVDLATSMGQMVLQVEGLVRGKGVLGKQRELLAVERAIGGVRFDGNPPAFMGDLVQAVQFGTQVQHAMFYGQAISPGSGGATKGFEALAGSSVKASAEAGRVQQQLTREVDTRLTAASDKLRNEVKVSQVEFQQSLLRTDGPILSVQRDVQAFSETIQGVQRQLLAKADVELITNIIGFTQR